VLTGKKTRIKCDTEALGGLSVLHSSQMVTKCDTEALGGLSVLHSSQMVTKCKPAGQNFVLLLKILHTLWNVSLLLGYTIRRYYLY